MMKKIRAKYEKHVFLLMMTLVMGLSISFIKTVQVQAGVMMQWLSGFLSTYVFVVPAVLVIIPVARE
jgi:hypothetical protein